MNNDIIKLAGLYMNKKGKVEGANYLIKNRTKVSLLL